MSLTPEQRTMRARLAAYTLHATHDPVETTKPARTAFLARFIKQVDPDNELPTEERHRRAQAALKAYMTALSLKSSVARARR